MDIGAVNTIIRMQEITLIPRAPKFVEGVINLRGSIIPVINLRKRFGLVEEAYTKSARIVVMEAGDQMIGVTVDAVAETLRLPSDSIELPSAVITSAESQCIRGVGKHDQRLVILLDVEKVLSGQELESLSKLEEKAKKAEAASKKAA